MNASSTDNLPTQDGRRRKLIVLAAAVAVGTAAYGAYWALYARYYQSTDDAYVAGDVVQVTSEVPGTVIAVSADDTQGVRRDQTLVRLDPADAEVAMQRAEANLAHAVRAVRALRADSGQLQAQIAERQTALARAERDLKRRRGLAADGGVSGEELSHSKESVASLRASLAAAREQLRAVEAQIDGTTIATHPQVLVAEAAVREAALNLRRTTIEAPLDGVIAKRSVQLGQHVAPGAPLMAVVPLQNVWVDANFKEGQLADMRVGQPVELTADIYGGSTTYHGKLVGLSAGSGSAFALLPAQNASGNWIKIVQRLPVRVELDPAELKAHPLRIGLSMNVTVDVRNTAGALIASQVRSQPQPQQASLGDDPAVEARIRQIVAANSGAATAEARIERKS